MFLAEQIQASFRIVDVGVAADLTDMEIRQKKIRKGTTNFLAAKAMSQEEAERARINRL